MASRMELCGVQKRSSSRLQERKMKKMLEIKNEVMNEISSKIPDPKKKEVPLSGFIKDPANIQKLDNAMLIGYDALDMFLMIDIAYNDVFNKLKSQEKPQTQPQAPLSDYINKKRNELYNGEILRLVANLRKYVENYEPWFSTGKATENDKSLTASIDNDIKHILTKSRDLQRALIPHFNRIKKYNGGEAPTFENICLNNFTKVTLDPSQDKVAFEENDIKDENTSEDDLIAQMLGMKMGGRKKRTATKKKPSSKPKKSSSTKKQKAPAPSKPAAKKAPAKKPPSKPAAAKKTTSVRARAAA